MIDERLRVQAFLRGKMAEKGVTNRALSRKIGTSEPYLSRQLHGHVWISRDDFEKICEILLLDPQELRKIFYLDFCNEGVRTNEYATEKR